jgi:hypothetical protein
LIYKSRVVSVYGMICDFTTSSKQRDYSEVMRLDKMLNAAYIQKPAVLVIKPMQQSILDGADLITRRLYIAMSFYHAQMTLHRKFMIMAKNNSQYAYSHTTCIDAALAASRLQADVHDQCQPGQMLHQDRWKILTLTQSEFLLATTIMCFNLDDDLSNARSGTSSLCSDEVQRKVVTALRAAFAIWMQQQEHSKEAQAAVKAIIFVLSRALNTPAMIDASAMSASTPRSGSTLSPATATTPGFGNDIYPRKDSASTMSGPYSTEPGTGIPLASEFAPMMSQDFTSADLTFVEGDGSELFDMDWSWDPWLQVQL